MPATGYGRRVRLDMTKYVLNQTPASAPTTWFASLATGNPNDDGQYSGSDLEPTIGTNGYARASITWNTATQPSLDAAVVATNSGALSFTSSGGGFSTGATNLTHVGIWTTNNTRTEAVFIGRAAISVPQAVNAAGITLTMASTTGLVMGLISA